MLPSGVRVNRALERQFAQVLPLQQLEGSPKDRISGVSVIDAQKSDSGVTPLNKIRPRSEEFRVSFRTLVTALA